jgi:cold-inducible RNA-binding protein
LENNKLYVGNLGYDVTEAEVRNVFAAHGTISSVSLVMDRSTGRSKGFAFVEMGSAEEARAAVAALNETMLAGRKLNVSPAKPREERSGGSRHR